MEDGVSIFFLDKELVLVQVGHAICITQFSQAEEIMCEARHDVARAGMLSGNGWYVKLGRGSRELYFIRGCANSGAWCQQVDMQNGGTHVCNGCVVGLLIGVT